MSRIVLPILIGIGVVIYSLLKQFDPEEFAKIEWNQHVLFWVCLSLLLLVIRHLAYANRLRVLSEGQFSWKKCIELIFIWEFSSAVSPTSVGGSAVAFFVLAQEKLSTAKTATIVLYTVVLDTIFFVGTLPVLFAFFGTNMIRPNMNTLSDMDGWGITFLVAYVLMATYGAVFYYGLFINPRQIRRLLAVVTSVRFLKRYQRKAVELGNEMISASKHLKRQNWKFHLAAFLSTATAWSCRFLLLNCLIIAFVGDISIDAWTQGGLYARLQTMFIIIAFSPTPGGAGFVEILFTGFLSDYVLSPTHATIISTLWRLMTYYAYLLIGVVIIPNWIRTVLNQRSRKRAERQ
ncbi:MAG: lysylphosphatidylglycerol synthase transmembrane domain-containing protein, partial [Bacteroidota bacterium]